MLTGVKNIVNIRDMELKEIKREFMRITGRKKFNLKGCITCKKHNSRFETVICCMECGKAHLRGKELKNIEGTEEFRY